MPIRAAIQGRSFIISWEITYQGRSFIIQWGNIYISGKLIHNILGDKLHIRGDNGGGTVYL